MVRKFNCIAFIIIVALICGFNLLWFDIITANAEANNKLKQYTIYGNEAEQTSQDDSTDEEKVVYLTFDDGPSYKVTGKLLDILKEHNVKATFFVVGKEIRGREDILKRMHKEGHSIGLHTYSHNFKFIYKNDENFIHEMKKTAYIVNDILGITPKAIRFPGGSARILNKEFLQRIHSSGYKVYDWNVDLYDGANASFSPKKLINNAKKAKGNQNERIILAHCNYNNMNTCKALSGIIEYYKENGFTFKTIENETKEYYYKFKR